MTSDQNRALDLKPCPFCASINIDPEGWMSRDGDGTPHTGPACDDCGASADSIERWNNRPLIARAEGRPSPEGVDPASHQTGWCAKRIDGRWCVGMTGNLDTIHDAVLVVNNHSSDSAHGQRIAEWVASTYTAALSTPSPERAEGATPTHTDLMVSPESIGPWLEQIEAAKKICDFMGWPEDGPAWDDANKLARSIRQIGKAEGATAGEAVAIKTVGWAALARNGNIRFWHADEMKVHDFACRHSCDVVRLVETPRDLGVSKADLIKLIMEATTDDITEDGLKLGHQPNILVQGCRFVRGFARGYEDPEAAALKFAGFIADAILAKLSPGEEGWRPIESAPDDFDETYFLVRPRGQHPARGVAFVPTVVCRLGSELFTPGNHIDALVWSKGGDMFAGPTTDIREADLEWFPLPPSSQEEGA